VTGRIAGSDDKKVRERILARNVDLLDVYGFEVFQGINNEIPKLIERQGVRGGLIGQMNSSCMR
jgi:hypothetical protein